MQILPIIIILNLSTIRLNYWETVADGDNGILKNAIYAVPLKCLNNFWRSLDIPLKNCKAELKLKWTKYCVLAAAGADNANVNSNNIIFTIKDTKLYVPSASLSAIKKQSKTIKNT